MHICTLTCARMAMHVRPTHSHASMIHARKTHTQTPMHIYIHMIYHTQAEEQVACAEARIVAEMRSEKETEAALRFEKLRVKRVQAKEEMQVCVRNAGMCVYCRYVCVMQVCVRIAGMCV